jgi:aldose 1-epimerase
MNQSSSLHEAKICSKTLEARILTYGASLCELRLADIPYSLVLGFPDAKDYHMQSGHFGAIAGPVANRIAGGTATLDGKILSFEKNENNLNTLHGGAAGTGRLIWSIAEQSQASVRLTLRLPDGYLGFPGPMRFSCHYHVTDTAELILSLTAEADQKSFCNLASHPYFCLDETDDFRHHSLQIKTGHYLPITDEKIPTGSIDSVNNTAFDYRFNRRLDSLISGEEKPIDHCFYWNHDKSKPLVMLRERATLISNHSGISMIVMSDQPGLQFYTGHGIKDGLIGHDGKRYAPFSGLCLEAQAFPDAPNQPHFPSIEITPDKPYHQQTRLCFFNQKEPKRKVS